VERLGDSSAFGFSLLEIVGQAGWEVVCTTPFAGAELDEDDLPVDGAHAGVLVIASRHGYEIRRTAPTLVEAAVKVFREAARMSSMVPGANVQLKIA
jgi:hypothetical protein